MSDSSVVFQTQLKVEQGSVQKNCLLELTPDWLSWGPDDGSGKSDHQGPSEIPSLSKQSDTVRVRVAWLLKTELTDNSEEPESQAESRLQLHYAVRKPNPDHSSDLSLAHVTFIGTKSACTDAVKAIQEEIPKKVPHRPKRLLVIINPVSGKGKGKKVYRDQVAPIFELCGIQTDVQVTQRAKHSDEILDKYDLTKVDGVISVGGDGTFTEVVNALLKRTMKDAGIDENDPDVSVQTPQLICSMLSAGSANGHPLYAGFSKNTASSAVMIAIGHSRMMDVLTVHCGRKFMAYALLLLGYGQMARIMGAMEDNRWAGPARYLALPFGLFFKRDLVEIEIEYLPAGTTSKEDGVSSNQKDSSEVSGEGAVGNSDTTWKKISGKYLAVDAVAINPDDPNYDKPCFVQKSLDNGLIRLWLTKECGRMEQIAFFEKLKKCDHSAMEAGFLELYKVRGYKVRVVGESADKKANQSIVWDGDMLRLPEPHFECRIHPSVLKIFTRDDGDELRQSYTATSESVKKH